ncbi:unnamed protein product [Rotaria sordida]|uniref:cAMP-dependent protein kinase catalytic subunit n=2 Tax=Rotaria sordida TaxID=392033 RepID=A0A814Y2Q7_9BILA|nr:unnamed protein product [Rotaria sordida]CAF1223828.1 unnamed protein product [Rotaria sordida]CAF4111937.1 unnamed protein product [Rotaria sordida]
MGNCSTASSVELSSPESQQSQTGNQNENENEINMYLKCAKQEFDAKYAQPSKQMVKLEDFQLERTIGMGMFGRVMLAKYENKLLALKIIEKHAIVEYAQVECILSEKRILQAINFPFIVSLVYSFKDNSHLYLALEFASGGEMFVHFNHVKKFSEDQVRFYVAQIVLILEYLHYLSIIYRNLKVEEILFAADGYLKLTDFRLAKVAHDRTFTLCGTPEYLAPEIITGIGYNKSVDYWALGILIYELAAGFSPFQDEDPMKVYTNILRGTFNTPQHFSSDLTDLIHKLLQSRPANRYGNLQNGVNDIKNHKWFSSMDWVSLFKKRIKAPYIPEADKEHYETYDEKQLTHAETELYPTEFENF